MALVFEHETKAQRVLFGTGHAATHLAAETKRIGAYRPFVVASARHEDLMARAGLIDAVRYGEIVEHVPAHVAADARAAVHAAGADLLIAIGGGSATGLAKAIALTSALPIVAVPTTFAGSEATDVWGLTENGRKRTGSDPRVLPAVVVYDADLFAGLPSSLAVASGLNAVAHAIDSMWAPRVDPIDAALAMEGLRALRTGLPGVVAGDIDATEQTLYGSYLAAVAFASAGSGLHHKICHVLGGAFGLRRTRPPMQSCCHTCWRSTRRSRRPPVPASPMRWGPTMPPMGWTGCARALTHPGHWVRSACAQTTSNPRSR